MTDEQIRELAEKHGFFGVDVWWQANTPRFRAMLDELAAYKAEAYAARRVLDSAVWNDADYIAYLAARVKDGAK